MNRIYESLRNEFGESITRSSNIICCPSCIILYSDSKFILMNNLGNVLLTSYTSLPMITYASNYIHKIKN